MRKIASNKKRRRNKVDKRRHTQVTRIDKIHLRGGLLEPIRVGALRNRRAILAEGLTRLVTNEERRHVGHAEPNR